VTLPLPDYPVDPAVWDMVSGTLLWLWLFVVCVVMVGGMMLLAHIVIPSLHDGRYIPDRLMSVRPILYGIAAIFFVGAVFVFVSFVLSLDTFRDIYPDVWI
jgi:hypothetical protein